MNKKVLLGTSLGVIGLAAAAYTGTSWYAGKQFETGLEQQLNALRAASPMFRISDVKLDRGIFSSSHEMTLAINPDCFDTGPAQKPAALKSLDDLKIRVRHTIQHGPLVNGLTPGMISYQGTVAFNDKTAQELKKLFGDKTLIAWEGVVQHSGSHTFQVKGANFDVKEKGTQIVWGGITGGGSGNIQDGSYKLDIRAPKLTINDPGVEGKQPMSGTIENISLTGQGRKGKSGLHIGTVAFGIDKFEMTDPRQGKKVGFTKAGYKADVRENGEFLDVDATYELGELSMEAEQKKFGPVVFSVGVEHLHAATLVEVDKSINKMVCAKAEQRDALLQLNMKQWKEQAINVLKHKPVLRLKELKFGAAEGVMTAKGKIALNEFDPKMLDDLSTAMTALPAALDIEFESQAPEKMLVALMKESAISAGKRQLLLTGAAPLPEQISALNDQAEQSARQQLQMAAAQNFVKQDGDQFKISFTFNKGQATLNGAPFALPFLPPPAGQPAAAAPEAPGAAPQPGFPAPNPKM